MLEGWDMLIPQGPVNWLSFDNNEHVTNISYSMDVFGMDPDSGNYMLFGHQLTQEPDRFALKPGQPAENASASLADYPTYDSAVNGDWFMTNSTTIEFAIGPPPLDELVEFIP